MVVYLQASCNIAGTGRVDYVGLGDRRRIVDAASLLARAIGIAYRHALTDFLADTS